MIPIWNIFRKTAKWTCSNYKTQLYTYVFYVCLDYDDGEKQTIYTYMYQNDVTWTKYRIFVKHHVLANKNENNNPLLAFCEGNSPVTSGFPSYMASNDKNSFMPWRQHGFMMICCSLAFPTSVIYWNRGLTGNVNLHKLPHGWLLFPTTCPVSRYCWCWYVWCMAEMSVP